MNRSQIHSVIRACDFVGRDVLTYIVSKNRVSRGTGAFFCREMR